MTTARITARTRAKLLEKEEQKGYRSRLTMRTNGERLFDLLNVTFMAILSLIMLYPFWYILIVALNTGKDAAAGGAIWFWPRDFTLANFLYVFAYQSIRSAFVVTVARCLIGSFLGVTFCTLAAYSLSKRDLPGRKAILFFLLLPMFIGGSIVSNFVVIVKLGLLNNFLVYILPGAFGFFSMVIIRTFIEGIPVEIEESAIIDGASYWQVFTRITLPLAKPVIAAFLFFGIVGNWLDLYTNLLYVSERSLYTLQYILYMVITSSEARNFIDTSRGSEYITRMMSMRQIALPTPQVIKMAVMCVVTFPILFVYPFFQKYFIKGMYLGSIKA